MAESGFTPPSGPAGPGGGSAWGEGVRVLEVRELGTVPYARGLELQAELVVERREGRIPDTLLLLEHPHVITLGTSSSSEHVLADDQARRRMGIELFETGRGGDVTYHGPGQLVGYPILDLKPDRKDLHRYLRDLEGALMEALSELGVDSWREDGLTGVWTRAGKVAAIGVRVSSGWITSHGFALNVDPDPAFFGTIVPCGIRDRQVATLAGLLGGPVTTGEVAPVVARAVARTFGRELR